MTSTSSDGHELSYYELELSVQMTWAGFYEWIFFSFSDSIEDFFTKRLKEVTISYFVA
jgi:hypothetical protein